MKVTAVLLALALVCGPVRAEPGVTKENVAGIINLARVDTTVACSGAVAADAVPHIRSMGFAAIINLRQPSEPGANIDEEAAAVKAAGLRFHSIPFDSAAPDRAAVDRFLEVISQPANQPAFIHCASGNRAAAMWFAKRVLIDKWDIARAGNEAAALGLSSAPMKNFMLHYIESHRN